MLVWREVPGYYGNHDIIMIIVKLHENALFIDTCDWNSFCVNAIIEWIDKQNDKS